MPSVSTLLETVKDLALVGAGDAADDARVMGYMNHVYNEVYRRTAKIYPTLLLTSENVTMVSGAGTLSAAPHTIEHVKNTSNNKLLEPVNLLELEDMNSDLSATGSPSYYYMTGTTAINSYPADNATLKVRYIPQSSTLETTTPESGIKIPPMYHDILIWGTLVYLGYDERDKASVQEVNTAQSKYELVMNDYLNWLNFMQPQEKRRTKAFMGG